jgi:hypothetical protein
MFSALAESLAAMPLLPSFLKIRVLMLSGALRLYDFLMTSARVLCFLW